MALSKINNAMVNNQANMWKYYYIATAGQTVFGGADTGSETIEGLKTFSISPVVPAAASAGQVVNYDQVIGLGQTWQDVTASRAVGVAYTNSTGKPIVVMAHTPYGATGDIYGYVAPHNIVYAAEGDGTSNQILQLIVPNGTQYSITKTSGIGSITKWYELR